MGLNERTLRALQMVDGEDRRARGDFVQDRAFNESQRQFDENTAMANARQRQQNRQAMRGYDVDESRVSQDAINEENRASEARKTRRDKREQQEFDNRLKKMEAKQTQKDIGKTESIEDVELKTELETAQAADAGITQPHTGETRHSDESVLEMNSMLSGDLPKETKVKFLSKYYGINTEKELYDYLRSSGYEGDYATNPFSPKFGEETGFSLDNALNFFQYESTDNVRDNIRSNSPFG